MWREPLCPSTARRCRICRCRWGPGHRKNRRLSLKLDPSGSNVIFCAYLSGGTSAKGVALDGEGNVYVAGTAIANYQTNLVDFPVTAGAFQRTPKCKQDSCGTAFVAKLNPSGTALVYSTFLDGSSGASASQIAVDSAGFAYLVGTTQSADFPLTSGALQTSLVSDVSNAFIAKLNPAGNALVYSTLLTGHLGSIVSAIEVDAAGNAYVAGGGQPNESSKSGSFAAKLNSSGTALIFANVFAPNGSVQAMALDNKGNIYVTGSTWGGLPVVGAFEPSFYGGPCPQYTGSGIIPIGGGTCPDAFVAALDASGSSLLYSTYLNGYGRDSGQAIAVDAQGDTVVGGYGRLSLAASNPLANWGSAFLVKLGTVGSPPFFTRNSITNGANFAAGLPPSGGLATIFCANLTGVFGDVLASGFPLPTELAGVRVKIGGVWAPLLSITGTDGGQQIDLQAPFGATNNVFTDPTRGFVDVEISQGDLSSSIIQVPAKTTPPSFFTTDGIYGAIQHAADYSLVTQSSPARPGEPIVLYGTGLGPVAPAAANGVPAPLEPLEITTTTPAVTIGGQSAQVLFSGFAPGFVGVYQINVVVPQNIAGGDQDVVVSLPPLQVSTLPDGSLAYAPVRLDSKPVELPVR